jgi:hypothetical protein
VLSEAVRFLHGDPRNNGPGVADQERIFDAFGYYEDKWNGSVWPYRVPSSRPTAVRLWAENNPAGGATFNVPLPVSPIVQTFDVS